MSSFKSQRPAVKSPIQRMREKLASMKEHISFVEEPVVTVAPTETVEDHPKTSKDHDIQPQTPDTIRESSICHSTVELIPVQRVIRNGYQYQFVKPSNITELCHDGWEVWTPKTTSSDTSSDTFSDNDDARHMTAESCSCQPAPYRIRYGDVVHLRPERCVFGWGDWDTYRPAQIVEGHESSKDWHAPTEGPFITMLQDGTGRPAINLFKLMNEQSRGGLTLREAIDLYQEQVEKEEFKEYEECDFCAGGGAGSAKVLFRV